MKTVIIYEILTLYIPMQPPKNKPSLNCFFVMDLNAFIGLPNFGTIVRNIDIAQPIPNICAVP